MAFYFLRSREIANVYPTAKPLLRHWGLVDSSAFAPFNGDKKLVNVVVNPERIKVLAPIEPLKRR